MFRHSKQLVHSWWSSQRPHEGAPHDRGLQYRPDIDGLRAIAVFGVVGFHSGVGPPGGFAGVDVFFVISGFLITGLIVRERAESGFRLAQFWARRIWRLVPALALMAMTVLALGVLILPPNALRQLGGSVRALGLIWSNFHFLRGRGYFDHHNLDPLLHTWSLAVEEQFYLFFPPLLAACLAPRLSPRLAHRFIVIGVATSLLAAIAGSIWWPAANFYLPFGRIWELLLGAALALWPRGPSRSPKVREFLASLGFAGIVTAYVGASSESTYPGLAALIPTISTALILWCGSHGPSIVGRSLSITPLQWIGLMSYSFYLWHWPVLVFLRVGWRGEPSILETVTAVGISLLIAAAAWRWVEQPCRSHKASRSTRWAIALWIAVSVTLVTAGSILRTTQGLTNRPWIQANLSPAGRAPWEVPGGLMHPIDTPLAGIERLPSMGVGSCERGIDFIFWGDSHGMAISEALNRAATRTGACGRAALRTGTAPLLGTWRESSGRGALSWNDAVMRCIKQARPRHVIMIARWSAVIDGVFDASASDVLMDGTSSRPDPNASREVAARALRRTVDEVVTTGAHCWILLEVPTQDLTPTQIQIRQWIGLVGSWSDLSVDRATHERFVAHTRELIDEVADYRDVHVIDLADGCFAGNYRAPAGDIRGPFYVDRNHLNDSGAEELLAPLLDAFLQRMLADSNEMRTAPH